MDTDIYALVAKYGFKNLHVRLEEIMRDEYAYFQTKFQTKVPEVKEVVQDLKVQRKKRVKVKEPVKQEKSEDVSLSLTDVELKDVIVTLTEKTNNFRDPKEMKEYQKNAVSKKHEENTAAGIQVSDILTKENLKQWIEDEGHTYAWVAREKSGCPETQVAATAQMMGIKSRISKKIGRAMTGN
jgi:hypothetical protein